MIREKSLNTYIQINKWTQFTSKYIQRVPPIVPLSQDETISNKKESLGNSLYDLVFTDRGDRIRTYDLVLPKHLKALVQH